MSEITQLNQENKQLVWDYWQRLDAAAPDQIGTITQSVMAPDVVWHGFDPMPELHGVEAFVDEFWQPLRQAFPDLKRQTHIFCSGQSNGRVDGDLSKDGHMWVSGTGYLNGTFTQDYLSIPATGQPVSMRWGEFCRVEHGRIVEIFFLIDQIDLMQQAGYQVLPPALGKDSLYPAPAANDGIMQAAQDSAQSAHSLEHIRSFIFDGLNAFDQSDLKSMGMADYFHPDVHWYGPGGIGACLSFKEFEDLHQKPWLVAYPDRQVQNLDALIAEGAYTGAPGFPGVTATQTGPYLDAPATDNPIGFNGLDWWKREGEQYVENWVFVDMVHLFRQFGIDLFVRLAKQIEARG